MEERATVRFGPFVFDGGRRQLRRGEEVLALSPKAFTLLAVLLGARPRALSQAEIHKALWPDTHVSSSNLPPLVAELRRALGEKGRGPGFLRTVQRFGYALEVPAVEERPAPASRLYWGTREIALPEGETVLGRAGEGIVALGDPTVSRRHARLRVHAGAAEVEDLGSRNGTFVDGERLQGPRALPDGARLRLGSVTLTFRVLSEAASTAELPGA